MRPGGPRTQTSQQLTDRVTSSHFLNESFSDLMRMSNLASNISNLFEGISVNREEEEIKLKLDWVVPDGTNCRLEE